MTRVPVGRGGRAPSGRDWRLALPALMAVLALALAGCSAKQSPGAGKSGAAGELGEEGLGGKTSLQQFQQGTLGGESGGPLHDIHFDFDDFTIRAQDGQILRSNATWLNQHATSRVQVEGHCDERGSEEYNIALGAKRAQAAKEYLATLGVAADRISTISYGKELALCTEHTESCWAQNRRDRFVVSQ